MALGTPASSPSPRPWLYFRVPAVMVNALEAGRGGRDPRAALGYEGELWLDSGGYQVLRRGLQPTADKVAEAYRRVEADFYLSLDVPPAPSDSPEEAERKAEATYRNYLALRRVVGDRLVPVVHVYPREDLFLRWVRRYGGAEALAIGGSVPYVLHARGGVPRNARQLAVRLIALARGEFSGRIHVLGLGSPAVVPALEAMGVDSADTATWRLKAAYGKVMMPGGGERHVTGRSIRFGPAVAAEAHLEGLYGWLKATGFPALDGYGGFLARLQSFEYRALVNAWVVVRSREPPRHPAFRRLYLQALEARQR